MTTYAPPEPSMLRSYGNPYAEGYTPEQMMEAYAQGQRDMREAAAKVCADLEYTGWDGEYMKHGPETDANQEFRKCAAVIRLIRIKDLT